MLNDFKQVQAVGNHQQSPQTLVDSSTRPPLDFNLGVKTHAQWIATLPVIKKR